MYDAIIVGARCAGSPVAMLLARQGARVLLVDRAAFPSDIPHGHFVHHHGPRRLQRWGLLPQLTARTPAVTNVVFDAGDFPLIARNVIEDGLPWGYGPRRATLDKILVDAAVESGAELRQQFHVEEYLFDDDRVVGIRGRGSGGTVVEERARITVGADGRNSRLARAVRAATTREAPAILCYYFSYWSGVQSEDFELYVRGRERRIIFSFKTEGGLFAIFIGLPIAELDQVRRDIEGEFMRTLDLAPAFATRVREGRREERFYGASDLPNFFRTPFGPGWALVGDAGIHKDPYLALGICDAWRDAELLAGSIADGLAGRRPMLKALADYERQRDAASAADYEETIVMANFVPLPPHVLALRAAVRHQPEEATRMFKARMGMIDPAEFFNRVNIERLIGAGGAPAPT
ncbi:MAG TPA: NAD(P)/FAD-dependent oxidoreductase [Vicinamibacterales bacterium]|nr:NAD(P)/FAD-dependent oxidoreductase [Vicinamibacterales bacterium]